VPNYILQNRAQFAADNYVRVASPENDYWVDFRENILGGFRNRLGDGFSLIIAGSADVESDFYALPFAAVKHLLTESAMYAEPRRRWIASITNHQLRVRNNPIRLDVSRFYGTVDTIAGQQPLGEDEQNDYAIENRKAEIKARQRQSVFRRRVPSNFGSRCCISRISEPDLLVASHVIPWADQIETRLDPSNGMCLFVLYDELFDHGYFTVTDDLYVKVTPLLSELSEPLQAVLRSIDGLSIRRPTEHNLRPEYLAYHREHLFRAS